jgi:uncharacterized phage-associated protein
MDRDKFANVVLYLLERAPVTPGVMQLLKMIFFADYEHYRRHLSPVTGAEYVALQYGPVVDGYESVFASLVEDGTLSMRTVPIPGYVNPKTEYLPRRPANRDVFSPSEIATLERVLREHGRSSGTSLSLKSHLQGPWQIAWDEDHPGRPIPYSLFRWFDNLPDEDDIAAARATIIERGLTERIAQLNAAAR